MVKYGLKYVSGGSIAVFDSLKEARRKAYKDVYSNPTRTVVIWAWYEGTNKSKDKGMVFWNEWTGKMLYNNWDEFGKGKKSVTPNILKQDGSLGRKADIKTSRSDLDSFKKIHKTSKINEMKRLNKIKKYR